MSSETPVYEEALENAASWLKNNAVVKGHDVTEGELQLEDAEPTAGSIGFLLKHDPVRQTRSFGLAVPVIMSEMTRQCLGGLHSRDATPIYAAKAFSQAKNYSNAVYASIGSYKISKIHPDTYTALTEVVDAPDVSGELCLRGMFEGLAALTAVPSGLNTERARDFRECFKGCSSLASVTNVDTTNARRLDAMFEGCTSLSNVMSINTSKAKSMSGMFKGCTAFTAGPDVDTGSAGDLSYFLDGCTGVASIPAYDTSRAHSLSYMLSGTAIATLPALSMMMATSTVGMMKGCTNLVTVGNVNTENAEAVDEMFKGDILLTTVEGIDMSKAIQANEVFSGCQSLSSLLKLNLPRLRFARAMFSDCLSLTGVVLKNPGNIVNANSMFSGCSSLTRIDGVELMAPRNMGHMLENCSSIASINVNTENAGDIRSAFAGCTSLATIPVLDMSSMPSDVAVNYTDSAEYYFTDAFKGCSALTSVTFRNASAELQAVMTAERLGNSDLTVIFE